MIELVVGVGIVLLALLGAKIWRLDVSVVLLFLMLAVLVPRYLAVWELSDDFGYDVEIARGAGPSLTTYGLVALAGAIGILFTRYRSSWDLVAVIGVGFLVIGIAVIWGPSNLRVWGGVSCLFVAVCCWVLGRFAATRTLEDVRVERLISLGVSALLVIELLVCVAQIVSGHVDTNGRPAGTFDHSGTLGKNAIMMMLIVLPMTRSLDRIARRAAWIALPAAIIATILTASRANLLGIVIAVFVWTMLLPTKEIPLKWKLSVPVVLLAASAPIIPFIIRRFEEDPDGGYRPQLWDAGMRSIAKLFWTGTGPNNSVATNALTEEIVWQTGYPMHNLPLVLVVELGIFGALAASLFVIVPLVRGTVAFLRKPTRRSTDAGRALIAVLIAIFPVAWTGWGMLGYAVLGIALFSLGFAGRLAVASRVSAPPRQEQELERPIPDVPEPERSADDAAVPPATR